MSLVIYELENTDDIKGLNECIESLREMQEIKVEHKHVPAVVGELAGIATEILLSDTVQITLTSIGIGQLLWKTVGLIKSAGKKLSIGANVARLIALFKASEDENNDFHKESLDFNKVVVYGPMCAEVNSELSQSYDKTEEDDECFPGAFFIGIVFPRPRNRVKTIWFLFRESGTIITSWSTQTFFERMPDFLNPNKKP